MRFAPHRHGVLLLLTAAWLGACSPGPQTGTADDATSGETDDPGSIPSQVDKLKLVSVTPTRGPLEGGGQIDLKGQDFADDARVFLGDKECEIAWRGGGTHLYAIVPAVDAPAAVDVKVVSGVDALGKPRTVGLTRGYSYVGETHVFDFAPQQGPLLGGTELTIHGSGFRPGDRVLVGWREATDSQVLDDGTIVALTPPGLDPGTADTVKATVAVRHASGVAVLDGAFVYGRTPTIAYVSPGVVPTAGAPVTLHGQGLGHATSLFAGGLAATMTPGSASAVRGAQIPAMATLDIHAQPGVRDMVVDSEFGASQLQPAFAYATGDAVSVLGVAPPSGSSAGGDTVAVLANVPATAHVQAVTFDGQPVTFVQDGGALVVQTPAHAAGPVDVAVTTDAGNASLTHGYLFRDAPVIDQIVPAQGPPTGGTAVTIHGSHFQDDCLVRFGTWHAQLVGQPVGGGELDVITPPGPMGTVDVTVTCGGLSATRPAGFEYTDGAPHINAVVPGQGATGGSTPVTIYGSGFEKGMKFKFGGKAATQVQVIDGAHAEMLTPVHAGGYVDITAIRGTDVDTLLDGYNFYDPSSSDGGTWGEATGGTLNVTVLDIYQQNPVPDATVILGQPGQPMYGKYVGTTDGAGQVVFHGADVVGPITVSASKIDYTASSIVSFDARNATILLFPYHPPSGGGGQPPPSLAGPLLEGRVRDIDKYVSVPPSNCLKSSDTGDRTCDLCASDTECTGGPGDVTATSGVAFACIDNGPAGKRCLPDCTQANVCGPGFACFPEPSRPGRAMCKPEIGIRKVFCATSQRDRTTPNLPPCDPALAISGVLPYDVTAVDEATGDYQLTGRLDELAIVCVGGYVQNEDQTFVPTAMGVRRHVLPKPYYQPGDEVAHLDIQLDIPLTRTLPIRLDHPQAFFPPTDGGTLEVDAWLDFGSDGTVQLLKVATPGGAGFSGVTNELQLKYLPMSLPEELTDTKWALEALVQFPLSATAGVTPEAGTFHQDVHPPGDDNLRVRAVDGTYTQRALGQSMALTGVLVGEKDELLVVAQSGKVFRGTLAKLKQTWQPPIYDPYQAPPSVLAAAGTPTDATLVGQDGLIRHVIGTKVVEEAGISALTLRGVCQANGLRVAVGDGGVMQFDAGAGWKQVLLGNPADPDSQLPLRAVVCMNGGAVAAGVGGRILRIDLVGADAIATVVGKNPQATWNALVVDAAGKLWVGGEEAVPGGNPVPALWSAAAPTGPWADAWPASAPLDHIRTLVALVNLGSDGVLLLDREGGQWRLDVAGVTSESPDRLDLRARAGVLLSDGSVVLVAEPGMWMGPFLTVPALDKPALGQTASPIEVSWTSAPGTTPTCNRVHMDGSGFPFWWIYTAPDATDFFLPNFGDAGGVGIQPFPTGGAQYQWVIRVDRIFVPGMTINSFSTYDLESGDWRSWATNGRAFTP